MPKRLKQPKQPKKSNGTKPSEMDVKLQVSPSEAKDFYIGMFLKAAEMLGYNVSYPTLKSEDDEIEYLIVGTPAQVDRIVQLIELADKVEATAKKKKVKKSK